MERTNIQEMWEKKGNDVFYMLTFFLREIRNQPISELNGPALSKKIKEEADKHGVSKEFFHDPITVIIAVMTDVLTEIEKMEW